MVSMWAVLMLVWTVAGVSSTNSGRGDVVEAPGSADFVQWCSSVGIGLNSVGWIMVEGPTDGQRHVDRLTVATAPISKGDPVLSVPLDTVLNVEHALADPITMEVNFTLSEARQHTHFHTYSHTIFVSIALTKLHTSAKTNPAFVHRNRVRSPCHTSHIHS